MATPNGYSNHPQMLARPFHKCADCAVPLGSTDGKYCVECAKRDKYFGGTDALPGQGVVPDR